MTSYQQPPPAAPSGPSTSSTSTRNSKLDQIIQNFYTKTAQIVIQARCTPSNDARYGKTANLKGSTSTKKMNKWFNIATEDVELLREDLKYWRTMAVQSTEEREPPPMILDIYLDTSKLSHNQSLVVADDNLRWGCVELKTADAHRIDRILIESWELTLKHPFPEYAVDLPNLYKRSIVFFRSLHSLSRLLPSYDLYRKLHKLSDSTNALSIGYRLSSKTLHGKSTEISLDTPIIESDARKPTKLYKFNDIVTPIGTFKLNVNYRRSCDFRIEDSERDLSAQFIDMDEQFFTPTMAKYQQQQQEQQQKQKQQQEDTDGYFRSPAIATTRPVSMFTKSTTSATLENKLENAMKQSNVDDDFRPSSLTTMSKHPTDSSTSRPLSYNARNTAESPTTSTGGEGRGGGSTPSSRRASAPFVVSPFKSPFLSSSPQAESIFSGAGSGGSTRHYSSTVSSDKSRPVDSGSFGRKIEFSSSFDKYKSSPTSRTATAADSPSSASMMRRWSRASDHSSINVKTEHDADDDDDLEDFVRLVGSNQDLGLFQQQRSTSAQMLSSASDSASSAGGGGAGSSMMLGASMSKKAALSHFQSLRETHNSLSDSLTSSMLIGNAGASTVGISGGGGGGGGSASTSSQQHDPVTGISPVSSTSSTGRSYQPIIPSPLHAEQRSTSPVHIPRSFPQLRSMTNPQNALRLARLNPAEGSPHSTTNEEDDEEEDESDSYNRSHHRRRRQRQRDASASSSYGSGNNDMSAFSTYPQDHHNRNFNLLRNTAATTGHTGGRASGTPISYDRPIPQNGGGEEEETRNSRQQQQEQQQQRRQSLINNDRYQLQKSQHNMDSSSDNSLMMMQDNANASSGPRANNSSLMDDDDSLVFKMSELECEGPPPPSSPAMPTTSSPSPNKQHDIFRYNNSSGNTTNVFGSSSNSSSVTATSPTNATNNRVNEHFLELTPSPLSPPLLHRLQNISMSTVTEEEERITNSSGLSTSGSSDKSDSNAPATTSNPAKPSHLSFDGW